MEPTNLVIGPYTELDRWRLKDTTYLIPYAILKPHFLPVSIINSSFYNVVLTKQKEISDRHFFYKKIFGY